MTNNLKKNIYIYCRVRDIHDQRFTQKNKLNSHPGSEFLNGDE